MDRRVSILSKSNHFAEQSITVDGLDYLVREPSAGQRAAIYEAATKFVTKPGGEVDAKIDHSELQVWAVLCCVCDPETKQPVFDKADHDALLALPSAVFDSIAKPALSMMNRSGEDEAKN
jgi:hypothetical protein